MDSLLEILRKSEDFLARKGVPEPRLDAEHLICAVLSCRRMDLYLQFDRPLTDDILDQIRPLIARRARREPLAQILGVQPFHELEIHIDGNVLCPRRETEELVEKSAEHLTGDPGRILDLGTGSGAIALWMKSRFPAARVIGTDRSEQALSVAKSNGERLGLDVEWMATDWLDGLTGPFDLILSNPPYLSEEEWNSAEPEVRDFEPREALVAASGGRTDLEKILPLAHPLLGENALLALETGIGHREPLLELARKTGYQSSWGEDDLQGRQRFLFCRR